MSSKRRVSRLEAQAETVSKKKKEWVEFNFKKRKGNRGVSLTVTPTADQPISSAPSDTLAHQGPSEEIADYDRPITPSQDVGIHQASDRRRVRNYPSFDVNYYKIR